MYTPKYSKEEHRRLARGIYERDIEPTLAECDKGKLIAIDVDSGAYVFGDDMLTVCQQLRTIHPHAEPYVLRVGYPGVHRFGMGVVIGKT